MIGKIITFEKHAEACDDCADTSKGLPVEQRENFACSWWRYYSRTDMDMDIGIDIYFFLFFREKAHVTHAEYSFPVYFAYLFYAPLHLAGPTLTFNSFVSHVLSHCAVVLIDSCWVRFSSNTRSECTALAVC